MKTEFQFLLHLSGGLWQKLSFLVLSPTLPLSLFFPRKSSPTTISSIQFFRLSRLFSLHSLSPYLILRFALSLSIYLPIYIFIPIFLSHNLHFYLSCSIYLVVSLFLFSFSSSLSPNPPLSFPMLKSLPSYASQAFVRV